MTWLLKRLATDASGATAIEYGLLLGFVALAIVGIASVVGDSLSGAWSGIAQKLTTVH